MGHSIRSLFLESVCHDTLGICNTLCDALKEVIKNNPKLLTGNIVEGEDKSESIVASALIMGSFNFVDSILAINEKTEIFYCGAAENQCLPSLLNSAGLNIYLALHAIKKNKNTTQLQNKKTHYEHLYRNNKKNSTEHAAIIIRNENHRRDVNDYEHEISTWFMLIAEEISQLEDKLIPEHDFLSFFGFKPEISKDSLHEQLGNHYLAIANMEDCHQNSFNYFLTKAIFHYKQSNRSQLVAEKLSNYSSKNREEIFSQLRSRHKEQFFDRDTLTYRTRSLTEWQQHYRHAQLQEWDIDQDGQVVSQNSSPRTSKDSSSENDSNNADTQQNLRIRANRGETSMTTNPLLFKPTDSHRPYKNRAYQETKLHQA